MSGMAACMVAVGGTSLICFLLMNRGQNRKARRESASDGSYGTGSSTDGWNLFSWGRGDDSSRDSNSSSDSGGDSGGGGGGGGGGD